MHNVRGRSLPEFLQVHIIQPQGNYNDCFNSKLEFLRGTKRDLVKLIDLFRSKKIPIDPKISLEIFIGERPEEPQRFFDFHKDPQHPQIYKKVL